jgi:acetylornithine/N-succinyldiaminopimelate aminotransferase
MNADEVKKLYHDYVISCYGRDDFVFVRGRGCYLWDADGNRYLDFFPGWAVSGLGHSPATVVKAISNQAKVLMHLSNNYYHPWQALAARKLSEISFGGKVFFCNSGAEANEGAIKLCRLHGSANGKWRIISMQNSFHGRTLATVTLTGQVKYSAPFAPLPEGFDYVAFNDFAALERVVSAETAGIFIEPIQGEGGINVANADYLKRVRSLCNEKGMLLVFDEVQTGMGKTGKYFAYQHFGVIPDVMTLAKTIGGGFPVGALVAKNDVAGLLVPGTHASTFGGNPLACAAVLATIETIEQENLLARAEHLGMLLRETLEKYKKMFPVIKDVRGIGLMMGLDLNVPGKDLVQACWKRGLLVNCTHDTVIRIMPPMNIKESQLKKGLRILKEGIKEINNKFKASEFARV